MSTSPNQQIVRYAAADFDADEPMDTVLVRDGLFGSALHKADEAGQVVLSWMATAPGLGSVAGRTGPLEIPYADSFLERMPASSWMDFPIRGSWNPKLHADRRPYRLRVRLYVARDARSIAVPVHFAVTIGPHGLTPNDVDVGATVSLKVEGVTSSTPVLGTLHTGLTYVDVPPYIVEQARLRRSPTPTLTDLGGAPTTVQTAPLEVMVCGRYEGGPDLSRPLLYGVHVAEYVGP